MGLSPGSMIRALGTGASLLLLSAAAARADFATQVRSVGETPTDWSGSLAFAPFDASQGVLTGVRLDATATVDHQFAASTPVADTVTVTAGPTAVAVGPYLTLVEAPVVRTAAGPVEDLTLPPAHAVLTASADLPVDLGPLLLPVSASSTSSFTAGSGNGHGEVRTEAALDLTLTYEFVPAVSGVSAAVPEPSSVVTWGLGMLAVALCRGACRRA